MIEPVSSLKVTHIASGDLWAGAEAQIASLLIALQRVEGVELDVILLNHGELEKRLRQAAIPVTVLDERQIGPFGIGWRLWRYLRQARPEIVHTHRYKENVLGSVAAALIGAKSVRSVHGRDEDDSPLWRLDKRLFRWLDRLCGRYLQQRLIAVSAQLGEELAADFARQPIKIIESGIDAHALAAAAMPAAVLSGRAERVRIGFIGRLVPVKRVDLFLQTARALQERQPDTFEFYIIGAGPQQALCQQLSAELGLAEAVHMLGFRVDVPAALAALDLLLMTSDHEGMPISLLEALSLQVPIVASAVGGIPNMLADGEAGTLVHEQQPQAYADAVLALLADPESLQRKVQRGLERARDDYSVERCAADYVALYRGLMNVSEGATQAASSIKTTGA